MSYRRLITESQWHWCRDCPNWPLVGFKEREDKPVTWMGQTLCVECGRRDDCSTCLHSVELRIGRPSDRVLGPVRYQ